MIVDLAAVVAQVESGGDLHAIRFEPAVYQRTSHGPLATLINIKTMNRCSDGTAAMIYSTSWGRFQVMGFNLYGPLGLMRGVVDYLNDADLQAQSFQRFCEFNRCQLAPADLDNVGRLSAFAALYNGPGNVADYVSRLIAARDRLRAGAPA